MKKRRKLTEMLRLNIDCAIPVDPEDASLRRNLVNLILNNQEINFGHLHKVFGKDVGLRLTTELPDWTDKLEDRMTPSKIHADFQARLKRLIEDFHEQNPDMFVADISILDGTRADGRKVLRGITVRIEVQP